MTKHSLPLPSDLDFVADAWRTYITTNIEVALTKEYDTPHIPGTHSLYELHIIFRRKRGGDLIAYYAGETTNPAGRASQHKSDINCCKATIRTGKSALFSAKYFKGCYKIDLVFTVVQSGFTKANVGDAEQELACEMIRRYGAQHVLTRPYGSKKIKPIC